jgi:3-oxoacyl-[acyl-carrier protein] reductase
VLDGRVMLVTGGTEGLGRDLAAALADSGATVVAVQGGYDTREAAEAAFASHRAIDAVVHARFDRRALSAQSLADTAEDSWDERSESVLRDALFTLQAAHGAFAGRGGRIVVLAPTIAMTGSDALVPFATAVEGMRALAKSAARQWGRQGITVNCVALPMELVAPGTPTPNAFVTEPALGHLAGVGDVAAAIGLFVGTDALGITGATVVVDGGTVMVP